jgi:hypothetical protein
MFRRGEKGLAFLRVTDKRLRQGGNSCHTAKEKSRRVESRISGHPSLVALLFVILTALITVRTCCM